MALCAVGKVDEAAPASDLSKAQRRRAKRAAEVLKDRDLAPNLFARRSGRNVSRDSYGAGTAGENPRS